MEQSQIKQECIKLMETADAAYLSTLGDDDFPHTRRMENLRNKERYQAIEELFEEHAEDFLIYMVTSHSSPKMKQIRNLPKVSVYFCSEPEVHTLLLVGNIEEVASMELKKQLWQDDWKMFWPGGAEDPEFVLLKLSPAHAKGWYKEGPFEFTL